MKKLLLSLVAVFAFFNANADRYWIHGEIFGNGWQSIELLKNESTGKFEKTTTLVKGDFGVKVTDDGGSNQTAWYSAPKDQNQITEAGTYPIQSNDNKNYSSTLEGNYTISLDWTAKKLTIEPYSGEIEEGAAYYELRGNCFGGNSWADVPMTEEDGIWSWTGNLHNGEFGIKKMVSGVQKEWLWAPNDRPGQISGKGTYKVIAQSNDADGKNLKSVVSGPATFKFNPEALTLIVEGTFSTELESDDYYFVGERTGWNAQETYKFTKDLDGNYILNMTNTALDPTKAFKINNGNFDDEFEWGCNANGDKVVAGTTYELGGKGAGDLFVSEAITNPHIVFNPEKSTLLITSNGGEIVEEPDTYPELFLTGSFQTNKWTLGVAKYKFTREENIYTLQYEGTFADTEQFKIADNSWNNDIDFGSNANSDKIVPGEAYTTVKHAGVEGNDHNLQLSSSLKNPKFVFNYDDLTLTVTGEEVIVEPVEPTALDYYIHGDIFASADWTSVKLTETEGKYILANREVESGKFGIRAVDPTITTGDPQVNWYASAGDGEVTLGTPLSITAENPTNFSINKGKYTFTLDLEAMTLTVTGEEMEDVDHELSYRIRGTLSNEEGAEWKDYSMIEKDGKWSVTVENPLVAFGVRTWCSAHNKQFEWIGSAADEPTANEVGQYEGKVNGANWTSTLEGKTTYTYDPETMTLAITQEGGDNPIPPVEENNYEYFIHGNIFGQWKSVEMTEQDGKFVLADIEVEKGEFGVKVVDPASTEENKQIAWYAASNEGSAEVTIGTAMILVDSNSQNLTINKGKYTFTFDPANATLLVTGEEQEDVDPVYAYAIKGAVADSSDWNSYIMTEENGVWTVTLDNALAEFGVQKIDTAHSNQQVEWYSSADENPAANENGNYNAKVNGSNWTSDCTGKATYTFDPVNMTLTISGATSGISAFEAEEGEAVYFNLQGQRVAHPDKGIYIRVVNGKTQKVVK